MDTTRRDFLTVAVTTVGATATQACIRYGSSAICHHEAVLNVDGYGDAGACLRAAHGLHELRNHRRVRAAELAGATAAGEPDQTAVAA